MPFVDAYHLVFIVRKDLMRIEDEACKLASLTVLFQPKLPLFNANMIASCVSIEDGHANHF